MTDNEKNVSGIYKTVLLTEIAYFAKVVAHEWAESDDLATGPFDVAMHRMRHCIDELANVESREEDLMTALGFDDEEEEE